MALTAGTKLGPYQIAGLLGAGGMGEVYRARDGTLGRDVAIKILPAAFLEDADRLRRFKQEAQAAAALNHPNILTIYHVGEDERFPYIVSELLEGESLRQRVQGGALPVRKVIEYGAQVARGLAAAHDKGIVHRDLKPENIFTTKDGRAKILDFGLAKLTHPEEGISGPESKTLSGKSEPGFVLGTVGYMSPEQVRGQAAGPASDLFSFGVVLYEALTGHRAFHGDTTADTMSAILKEDPPDMSSLNRAIPPALERVVRHCLEKNPEERFQSARDVAFNLEALSQESGSSRTTPYAESGARSRTFARIALALATFILVGAAAFFLGRLSQPKAATYQRLTFRNGTIQAARFTPDGESVVYSESLEGTTPELFTTHPRSPESRALGLKNSRLLSVSSKGEMAVLMSTHAISATYVAGTLARVPLDGGAPREVLDNVQGGEWSPDGSALLITREVGGMNLIECPPGNVIYKTSGVIGNPRFSPSGDRIAFFEHPGRISDDGAVAVVDLGGHKTTLSEAWTDLTGLAWSVKGDEIWFTGDRKNTSLGLFGVSLGGKERLVERTPGDLVLYDIARDGRVLMGIEDWRGVMYGMGPGEDHERDLSWFDFSIPTDISKDGRTVLFIEDGEMGGSSSPAFIRGTDGAPAVRLSEGSCSALSRDTQRVICTNGAGQLIEVPTKAGNTRVLTRGPIIPLLPEWFPDEKRIAFLGQEPGHGMRIYVQDLDGFEPKAITPEGAGFSFRVSPDGKWVAVAMDTDFKTTVYPASGGKPLTIAGFKRGDAPAAWSHDGRFLYTYGFGDLPARVFETEIATGKRTLWKQLAPPDPVGVTFVTDLYFSDDLKSYAYNINRRLDILYLVEELH